MEVCRILFQRIPDGSVDLGFVAGRSNITTDVLAGVDVDDLVDGGHPRVDRTRGVLVLYDGEVAGEEHFHALGAGVLSLGGALGVSHVFDVVCLALGAM